ncbi:hypothetical protein GGR61_000583 [Xanthomonas arboricola]|nr:hypothetical protein [Xanthomonas sp. 3058]
MADQLLPVDLAATRQQCGLALRPAGDPRLRAVGTPTSQFNTNEVAARIMPPGSQTSSPIKAFCTALPNSARGAAPRTAWTGLACICRSCALTAKPRYRLRPHAARTPTTACQGAAFRRGARVFPRPAAFALNAVTRLRMQVCNRCTAGPASDEGIAPRLAWEHPHCADAHALGRLENSSNGADASGQSSGSAAWLQGPSAHPRRTRHKYVRAGAYAAPMPRKRPRRWAGKGQSRGPVCRVASGACRAMRCSAV